MYVDLGKTLRRVIDDLALPRRCMGPQLSAAEGTTGDRGSDVWAVEFTIVCRIGGYVSLGGVGDTIGFLAFKFRYLDLLFDNCLLQLSPLYLSI